MNAQVKASSRSFSNLQVKTRIVRPKIQCTKLTLEQQDEVAQAEANDNSFLSSNEINSTSVKLDKVDTLDARADEIACETKVKHARYLLHYLVPCLSDLNRDQMVEREIEAKIQGLELSELSVEQADCRNDERMFCDNCRT
ncbi:lysine-specific demethylase JMJ25-like [Hordeum vulgare]|nr:lysine-specific demethylase JMJ25-like [Hordeum vulgare]